MQAKKTGINDDYIRVGLICFILVIIYIFIIGRLELNKGGYLFFQNLTARYAHSLFYSAQKAPDITLVALDDTSLRTGNLKWPWPRARHAEMISKIAKHGPKVIAIDISFIGRSTYGPEDDALLAASIKDAGCVVLASYIGRDGVLVEPLSEIGSQAKAVGFVNKVKDAQSLVRSAIAVKMQDNKPDFSFEIKAAALYKMIPASGLRLSGKELSLGDDIIKLNLYGAYPIMYTRTPANLNTITVSALFEGDFDPSLIKDRMVMIGRTAEALHDIYLTPLGAMPGVVVNANVVDELLSNKIIYPLPLPYMFLFLVFLTLIIACTALRSSLVTSFGITTVAIVLICLSAIFAYRADIEIDTFGCMMLLYLCWFSARFYLYIKESMEKSRMLDSLIIDRESGLYNTYYLLLNMQKQLTATKSAGDSPALVLIELLNEKDLPLLSVNVNTRKELIAEIATVLKEEIKLLNGMVVRTADFEFGLMVSGRYIEKLKDHIKVFYEHVNSLEFLLPEHRKKFSVRAAIGVCFSSDFEKKSAELVLYAAQEALSRARALPGEKIYIFDAKKEKIGFHGDDKPLYESEGRLADFVIEDMTQRNRRLLDKIDELNSKIGNLKSTYMTAVLSLVKALDEKDVYTAGHSERVARYAVALADKLDMADHDKKTLEEAALLHDIGKIGIPDVILHKKAALDDEERAIMQKHAIESVKILEPATFLKEALPLILHHHERFDGGGYPHGLSGERIPLGAAILGLADSFDAMTSGRGYNRPMTTDEASEILRKESGKQFEPSLVEKFIAAMKELPDQRKNQSSPDQSTT